MSDDITKIEAAKEARVEGNNERAGRYYALAAFERLVMTDGSHRAWLAAGAQALLRSAICYRIAPNAEACETRCHQGMAIIQDADELVYDEKPLHGLRDEIIGDFRLIGELGGHREAYETARETYAAHEAAQSDTWNTIRWQSEDEFQLSLSPFLHVAWAVGHEFENPSRIRNSSLLARIDAKADLFEDFLFEVEEKGVWTWSEG
jgi:hypothetical protein